MKQSFSSNPDLAVTWQQGLSLIADEGTINEKLSFQDLKWIPF